MTIYGKAQVISCILYEGVRNCWCFIRKWATSVTGEQWAKPTQTIITNILHTLMFPNMIHLGIYLPVDWKRWISFWCLTWQNNRWSCSNINIWWKNKQFFFEIWINKQGLRRTQKLQPCTNWKVNHLIYELAKASNKTNSFFSWFVHLVRPAGLSSWSI